MIKNCYNCDGFIEKSKRPPYHAFDYIAGNKIGVCNYTETISPLQIEVDDCDRWKEVEVVNTKKGCKSCLE